MKRVLRIAGSLLLAGLLAWRLDVRSIGHALAGVAWGWWLAALGCYVVAQVVSAVRWRDLSRPLGFTPSLGTHLGYLFAGNFFNLVLPTSVGGDVARAWYLARGTGKGPAAALCVLADRLIGLYVLVAMACVAALLEDLPAWVDGWVAAAGCAGLVGMVLLWLARRPGAHSRLPRRIKELAESLAVYRSSPALMVRASAWSLAVQVLNVALVWCVAVAAGADVSPAYCFVVMPLVTLLTLAPISVNGMGVREGGTVLLLAPVGVAAEQAVTVSLLWFSVFVAVGLAGGIWLAVGRLPRGEGKDDAQPLGGHPDQGRAGQPATAA